MAYRLRADLPVADELRRCAVEELDHALDQLSDRSAENPVRAVHEARKSIKKERALLRLARGGLPAQVRRTQLAQLRDAAQRLAGVRDADVALETLAALHERYATPEVEAAFRNAGDALERARDAQRAADSADENGVTVVEALDGLRAAATELPLTADGWQLIAPGLRRAYGDGRAALRAARREPTTDVLHDWRKRVKDLWYDSRLLHDLWPPVMAAYVAQLEELSELLGADHDHAVLRDKLAADASLAPADVSTIGELVERRRAELLAEALGLGELVYAEKPRDFERRVRRWWRARAAADGRPAGAI